jgi:PAS domain S-box-containing protein
MNIFALLSFISVAISFFFGTVVIIKNPRHLENRIFSTLCYLTAFLGFIEYSFRTLDEYQEILLWGRFLPITAILPSLTIHFVLTINDKIKKTEKKLYLSLIYGPGILFCLLGIFTDLFGKDFRRMYWGWTYGTPDNVIIIYVFFLWIIIILVYSLVICFKNSKNILDFKTKNQIKYIEIGIVVMLSFFLVFDTVIIMILNINFPEMTLTGYTIFCVIFALAMWKHELFSVNFQDFVETSSKSFLELNLKGNKVVYINPELLKVIGYTRKEIESETIFPKIIYPKDISNLEKEKEDNKVEFRIIAKNGEIKWLSGSRIYTYNKNGGLDSLRLWLDEITDQKNLENLKANFVRRTSHELKTPLISIKGFAELILSLYSDELNPDINLKLDEIIQGCERLQNIIEDLLHTSKLESSDLKPKLENEDLSFLIRYCIEELHSLAIQREHSINIEIADSIIARFEKEEIHDVLTNLLTNAIKYTPPKGWIDIRSEILENFVIISIKDNGIGFTKEEKKKIFQQFGKIERYGQGLDLGIDGTGLGLYISKKIIESHGGKIWMESDGKNKGSTFFFSLPIIKD